MANIGQIANNEVGSSVREKLNLAITEANKVEVFHVDINRYGFLNQTETTLGFNDSTFIFTLGSVGASWSYYRAGLKHTITGNKTINLTTVDATLVNGAQYFIYLDSIDGTLSASRTAPWTLNDTKVPVAIVLWNSTLTPKYWIADERHTVLIDRREHYRVHLTEGTRPISVGELAGFTINNDVNADKVFSIAESKIIDEDIILTLSTLAKPNGTATDYTVFYRTDADTWAWKASNMPFVYNVGNTNDWIQWDNNGTMTDATGGSGGNVRWVNSYLVLTNYNGAARFAFVMGQGIFTTLASAQAEAPSSFDWGNFPIQEAVIAYRITWTTTTSTSQGKCRMAATPQPINISPVKTLVSGGAIDHNTLAGLNNGDYQHLTQTEKGYLPTADEKAALAGTGTPSASNKYSTADHNHSGTYLGGTLSATITLTSGGWSTNSQSVTVTGVTSNSNNFIVLESSTMGDRWAAAKIYATSQTTDSITFSCQTTPTQNIEFKVLILK